MVQSNEETNENFLKRLKAQEYIISGQEVWDFIEQHTFFDDLDMVDWFKNWLKSRDIADIADQVDLECPDCCCHFTVWADNTYVRL